MSRSPSARLRRRRRHDPKKNRFGYESVSEIRSGSTVHPRISRPSKPYLIYDVHSVRSPTTSNVVRPSPMNETIDENSVEMDPFSTSQNSSFNVSRVSSRKTNQSNVSVKRVRRK